MKKVSTTVVGGAGLLYGLLTVLLVYRDAPFGLQVFIVSGVAATGASVGWLVGVAAIWLRRMCRTKCNQAASPCATTNPAIAPRLQSCTFVGRVAELGSLGVDLSWSWVLS